MPYFELFGVTFGSPDLTKIKLPEENEDTNAIVPPTDDGDSIDYDVSVAAGGAYSVETDFENVAKTDSDLINQCLMNI